MNRWDVGDAGWELLPRRLKARLLGLASACLVAGLLVVPGPTQRLEQRLVDAYVRHKVEPFLKQLAPPPSPTVP